MARLVGTVLLLGIIAALRVEGIAVSDSQNGTFIIGCLPFRRCNTINLQYLCVVYLGYQFSYYRFISDTAATLVIVPEDSTAQEGNTLIFTCVGYGVPTPEMTWLKNGTVITNGTRVTVYVQELEVAGMLFVQTTLEICGLNISEDSGLYGCQAANANGTETAYFEVSVKIAGWLLV